MKAQPCPGCGRSNTDDWPLEIEGEILEGGCQECWEADCDKSWWEMVVFLDKAGLLEEGSL